MGKLIVIEGTDGSGKSTQFRLLTQRLENENIAFQKIVFPQYSEPSSALIRMYLGGEFGTNPSDVNAYAASSFYAIDRYASYKKIWGQWYEQGGLVVCDRYTTSNAVHQASKEPEETRQAFLKWLYDFEYDRLGLHEEYTEYLGNKIVCHSLPIRPGRNLAIIVESAAVNHRQKKMGYNAAEELYKRVQANLAKKREER